MSYQGLSKFDLKKAMLAALGELSNLRADSKSLRRRLESTRSALAEIHHRISLIQRELDKATIVEFPSPNPVRPALSASTEDTHVVPIAVNAK